MKKSLDDNRLGRLLVLCARPGPGPRDLIDLRRLLRPAPDWELLIRRADEEGLLPLLFWNLRNRPDDVPPDVLERLKVHYLRNLARNVQIARQIEPFLRSVRDSGLRVVLTKGLRLASTVYPDIALRPFWDVDLVAHPADWPAVKKILDGQGFEETPEAGAGPGRAAADPAWAYSPYFRRGDLVLEFHFNVLGLHFPARAETLSGMAAGTMVFRGTEVAIFSPEHELCHLCLHAQQHSYQKLVWLADIAEIASRKDIAWDKISGVCDSLKIHASVYHGLVLVNALWPGTVPQEVLSKLRPRPLPRAALRFLWPEGAAAGRENYFSWPYYMPTLFSLWERKSLGLAARTLPAIFFPPRPWLAQTCGIPENSLRLYYQYARRLSRPVGLAVRRLVKIR
jgi:hypothetical protein